MTARVADALPGWLGESTIYAVAVCLAPVVARLAREQAAEELLKAGGYFHDQGVRDELILGYLDRRAAALRGDR
jgi:hypothetical protein